jgi:hypothetical protein
MIMMMINFPAFSVGVEVGEYLDDDDESDDDFRRLCDQRRGGRVPSKISRILFRKKLPTHQIFTHVRENGKIRIRMMFKIKYLSFFIRSPEIRATLPSSYQT